MAGCSEIIRKKKPQQPTKKLKQKQHDSEKGLALIRYPCKVRFTSLVGTALTEDERTAVEQTLAQVRM
jgi:hypothetical protein